MPSGWTTSGIDWSDIRRNRTEDIVRELYLATHERDFWVRRWTQKQSTNYNTSFPNIEYTSRIRMETQLRFIFDTVRSWLTLDLNPSITDVFVPNQAVWIDDNQIPIGSDLTDTVNLGIPHWDMSKNGNLETELSLDLSFLRDYIPNNLRRINLDDFDKIYKILRFLTKCRAYQIISDKNGTGFDRELQNLNISLFGSGVYARGHNGGIFGNPRSIDTYNNWANSTPTIGVGEDPVMLYNQRTTSIPEYLLNSTEIYFQFINMNGFNTNQFTSDDFDFKMIYFNLFSPNTPNPDLNIINGVNELDTFYEPLGAKCFPFPNTDMQNFPPTPLSLSDSWRNTGYVLPYADMNKEGFLKYYTEE